MGKLRDEMQADMTLKRFSVHIQKGYLRCATHFARHFMRSPAEMGTQEVREFLLHRGVMWSSPYNVKGRRRVLARPA